MKTPKVRVYQVAREWNLDPRQLVEICQRAGIDVCNQLSPLDPGQRQAVEKLLRERGDDPPMAAVPRPR